tara:strand:+ start:5486 stop:7006 length:1521 start_codon:yes stop_codon:yes gene_type:complete
MVLSQRQIGIFGAVRGFPARKGASRTVDGVKQYTLYTEDDLELVGCYDENNNLVFKIVRLPKREVLDTYTFPVKTGTSISQEDVDGIYNDFVNQLQQVQAQEEQEIADSEKVMQINVLQEEQVGEYTIKLTEILDAYFPSTQTYGDTYEVSVPSNFGGLKNFDTLVEAQAYYDQIKQDIMNRRTASGQDFEYNGYTIRFQETKLYDGTTDLEGTFFKIEGLEPQYESTFKDGDVVEYRGAMGTETFGTISLDVQNDLIILKQYLDIIDNPPAIEGDPVVVSGELPIYSWGWYRDNSPDSPYSPFSTVRLVETYTVAQTDGRIMGVTDSDIWTVPSGAVRLVVKDGYRVILRLLTQEIGYWESHLPNIESDTLNYKTRGWMEISEGEIFNQETNYTDTDLIDIELVGGDSVSIDIDSEVEGIGRFSVISNGKQIVKGAPRSIDNETFLVITEVFAQGDSQSSDGSSGGGGSSGSSDNENQPMTWLPVVIAGVLILGIMYLVFGGGDE